MLAHVRAQLGLETIARGYEIRPTLRHPIRSDRNLPGHPARHKLEGAAFSRSMGLWWGQLLTSLREHVALRNGKAASAQERGEGDQG